MPFRIVPIVEGHGEVEAVRILLHRLIAEFDLGTPFQVARPIRQPRSSLLKAGGLERAVNLAAIEMGETGAVLVLLDSDGECPAELGPTLLARAQEAHRDKRVAVILAHREFEAWFLASASSLKGRCGLNNSIEDHPTPEEIQDCKRWLKNQMAASSKYEEPVDQPALAAVFALAIARQRSPSFDKFWRDLGSICRTAV